MFKNLKVVFIYYMNGKRKEIVFSDKYLSDDFNGDIRLIAKDNYNSIRVCLEPKKELVIDELYLDMDYGFKESNRIFVNGYQSWTDSREFFTDETIRTISKLAAPLMNKYQFDKYGDYNFKKYARKPGEFHGYTYSYIRNGKEFDLIGSLSERSGYTIIEESVKNNKIVINKECKDLHIKNQYVPFEIAWIQGSENEAFDTYFNLMNIKKPNCKPMTGWTSWYNYYQNINEEIILENLNNFKSANKNIEIFQIDDGYQTAVGDWLSIDNKKFPNGMKYIADSIKKNGYKAGIWLAPFACETNSIIFEKKKNWILKDEMGKMVLGGGNWSRFYALDIYNKEVREYIKNVFNTVVNEWGYDMVKLDFLYAACIVPRKDKTRGQIMTEAMEFLRECVGDKLILGCGVPLGPAFGLVDYCRIGCDVGLDWDDKFFMRKLHRERVSTLNAIGNAIGRRHLNGRAFLNDPDVFLLRDDNMTLTEVQRKTLSTVNNIFGSLLFTSDNIKMYDDKKHEIFDYIMDLKDKSIESVETYKNGLVEVLYKQGENKYLALINLSDKSISYINNYKKLEEMFFDKKSNTCLSDKNLIVAPFESRIFITHQ